jgi:trimeric autotransporter adhesin
MATYLNDLRLTELATGEGSGTWGTTTNLSLELIGEALGYATQQVFGSDADATTTIADGASDPARAMYFKITSAGSLTATRTCTIAPNTISRVMFIENATTGSQSIQISQGSGASVTILTGKTAVVYLDGAGATAAVVDAMAGVDPGVTDTLTEVLVAGNTSGGTNIELSTTDKVQFRDAAIYINSSVDGQLDIVADTEIQIAATTIDINGAINASGEIIAASLDISGDIDVDGVTNLDVVDIDGAVDMASTALVTGVLTTTAATVFNGGFASNAASTITTADNLDTLSLISTDADASVGPNLRLYRNSGSPADSDALGRINAVGRNDASQDVIYSTIETYALDVSDGTESAVLNFNVMQAGASVSFFKGNNTEVVVNDDSRDLDFRVESDGNANMLFVDGGNNRVGVGISAPVAPLHTTGTLKVSTGNAQGILALGEELSSAVNVGLWRGAENNPTSDGNYLNLGGYNGISFATGADVIGSQTTRFRIALDGSLSTPTLGTSNVRFGVNAGNSIESGGNYNVVIGDEAGTAITTGDQNVAIGFEALSTATTASRNTAVGLQALKVNTGDDNSAFGYGALILNTTGTYNTAVGRNAGAAVTTGVQNTLIGGLAGDAQTTASNNTAVGYASLGANTTGPSNTAIGHSAMAANTTGNTNTAVGNSALAANTVGDNNTALGNDALASFNPSSNSDTFNTAVGSQAGAAVTTGIQNTLIGGLAGDALTDADYNVALGANALSADTLGSNSVAIGAFALRDQNFTSATDTFNVAVGYNAGGDVTTGIQNTLIGGLAGDAITTGDHNVATGTYALTANTTGGQNVAIGRAALEANTTASNNTAVGNHALLANTTGIQNTALGALALDANTTANDNVAIGYGALTANTTGSENTAVGGYNTLGANTTGANNVAVGRLALTANTTASNNTAVGKSALAANTTASDNTSVGAGSMDATTTGAFNSALGSEALGANTTGASNVAVGVSALAANTTASNNTAVGRDALAANTTGAYNNAVGVNALTTNTTGDANFAGGWSALYSNTTGESNVAIGHAALNLNTTASNNTAFGANSLQANTTGFDLAAVGKSSLAANTTGEGSVGLGAQAGSGNTTASNNVYIGNQAGVSGVINATGGDGIYIGAFAHGTATDAQAPIVIGYNVEGAAGYTTLGNSADDIRAAHGVATWATVSDERYKKDIVDSTTGLSFINALRPRTFKYKTLGELPETFSAYEADSTKVFKNSETNHGFIAQEIKAAIDADASIKDGFRLWNDREDGSQEVAEAALIPVLVKAIQELTARLEALEGAN